MTKLNLVLRMAGRVAGVRAAARAGCLLVALGAGGAASAWGQERGLGGPAGVPGNDSGPVIPKRDVPKVPAVVATPIDPVLRQKVREALEQFAVDANPYLRSNAIEAASKTMGEAARPLALRGLSDMIVPVRFSACVAVGDLKYGDARPQLLKLAYDEDPNVRLAARYALHKLGDTSLTQEMASLGLRDDRIRVRGNAVLLLGLLGEPSAIKPLRQLLKDPAPSVRLQVSEALWRLGDDSAMEDLVGRTISPFADDQTIAVFALVGRRAWADDKQRQGVVAQIKGLLVANFPEVELSAARALGVLGSDAGYGVALKYIDSSDTRQRGLAALTLGDIGRSDSQAKLKKLLEDDKSTQVRLAAATAILKLKAP